MWHLTLDDNAKMAFADPSPCRILSFYFFVFFVLGGFFVQFTVIFCFQGNVIGKNSEKKKENRKKMCAYYIC